MKFLRCGMSIFVLLVGIGTPSGLLLNSHSQEIQCNMNRNCSECIQSFHECKWCKDDVFVEKDKRCFHMINQSYCANFEDPKGSEPTPMKSDHSAMSPNKFFLSIRPGEKKNLSVIYTDEKDRPLDLYILMDLSCTMKKQKQKVAALAGNLTISLKTITSDLELGFGSFVDKPIGPYDSMKDDKTIECDGEEIKRDKPYVFKNHLSMTKNVNEFIESVSSAQISTNLDTPEGGLDALMQAISCTKGPKGIGWRSVKNKTRKLVVVSTDGPFHIAGDGRLGGIIKANDGKCHLDENRVYSKEIQLDYPSIAQVRDRIKESFVFVVFAVTKGQLGIYTELAKAIGTESASAQSIDDQKSIAEVIESEYKKVVGQVFLRPVSTDHYELKYFVKCPGEAFVKGNGCSGLTPGAKVEFIVEVAVKKCPGAEMRSTAEIQVSPFDSIAEHNVLRIDLKMLCECECEAKGENLGNVTESAIALQTIEECSNNGFLQCGICKCNKDWGGSICNCPLGGGQTAVNQSSCQDPNGRICTDRGDCVCGECKCSDGFAGKLCQCRTDGCLIKLGEDKGICNSKAEPSQGKCECRKCKCNEGFHGERCECPDDKRGCRNSESSEQKCSGKGDCPCNKCKCHETFHGQYCELQYSKNTKTGECSEDLIERMKSCIKCLLVDNSETRDVDRVALQENGKACFGPCEKAKANITFTENADQETGETEWCPRRGIVKNKDNCDYIYIVGSKIVSTGNVRVKVERQHRPETCPIEIAVLPLVASVVGIVVLIGIVLLLIWKIVTHIHDKKEFLKFENETKGATWNLNQNPLYKGTVSEFQNPAYSSEMEDDKNK